MVLIFTLLFSINIYAQHNHDKERDTHMCLHNLDGIIDCLPGDDHEKRNEVQKILDWWAATKNNVANTPCSNPGDVPESTMLTYLNRNSGETVNDSFYGMTFEDEDPHQIELLRLLTKYDEFWNFNDEDNLKDQKTFQVPEGCKKVLCAAKSIFGEKEAVKLLYLLDRYEINLSHVTDNDTTAWSDEQLDTILEAVDDLPSHLIPFEKNQYFKHYKNGYGPSASTLANATITFYDPWDNLDSKEMQRYTVTHEIGHNIGGRLDQDEDPEWLNISGWVQIGENWKSTKDDELVSKYGATNPAEDFAEAFSGYRYDPETLKRRSPEKYEYMKNNVFLGIEYTSEEKCQESNSTFTQLLAKNATDSATPQNFALCEEEMLKMLQKGKPSLKSCLEKTRLSNIINNSGEFESAFERDALMSALSFKDFTGESVTNEQEKEAYKVLLGDMLGSVVKDYWNYSNDCTKYSEFGWQATMDFSQYTFGDKYHQIADSPTEINTFIKGLCEGVENEKITCQDLIPLMQKMTPSNLGINYSKETVRNTSSSEPNDFRCIID